MAKRTPKIIGETTTYHGTELSFLTGYKVRIVAILKNAAKPDLDLDGHDYYRVDDDETLACVGGITAHDRIEVQPWLSNGSRYCRGARWSFVTSDPKATDLGCFKTL